jgi:hypothetical protein
MHCPHVHLVQALSIWVAAVELNTKLAQIAGAQALLLLACNVQVALSVTL